MDFDAIFQQINLNLSRKLYGLYALIMLLYPQRTFGNPLRTFRQSFASRVLQNWDFSCYGENFLPIRGEYKGASSGFGRLGQNPVGAKLNWKVLCIELNEQNKREPNLISGQLPYEQPAWRNHCSHGTSQ